MFPDTPAGVYSVERLRTNPGGKPLNRDHQYGDINTSGIDAVYSWSEIIKNTDISLSMSSFTIIIINEFADMKLCNLFLLCAS